MIASTTLVFFFGGLAHAKLPLNEIEALRRQTVVTRVALDNPQGSIVKKCKLKIQSATLGGKLELVQDNFSKPWGQLTIGTEDLHELDAKAQACSTRASCSAYEAFVAAAKVDPAIQQEVGLVKEALDKNSKSLSAKDYLKAWKGIPNPCLVLKQMMK